MKNTILFLFATLFLQFGADAQFYSGKYTSTPQMEDFDHITVHQHPHHHKYGGNLTVKAFVEQGELWHSTAEIVSDEKAEEFKTKFADGMNILSVYELDIELDGEEWEYFLLGYANTEGHPNFLVVEEIFDMEDLETPIEINTFEWTRFHGHQSKM